MTDWCETQLDDENKFELSSPPDRQEFEVVGDRQDDGTWKCTLTHFPGGTVNVSMPVKGQPVKSFTADSPDQAKQIADSAIEELKK